METAQNKRQWSPVVPEPCACRACVQRHAKREIIIREQERLFDDTARPGRFEAVQQAALLTAA